MVVLPGPRVTRTRLALRDRGEPLRHSGALAVRRRPEPEATCEGPIECGPRTSPLPANKHKTIRKPVRRAKYSPMICPVLTGFDVRQITSGGRLTSPFGLPGASEGRLGVRIHGRAQPGQVRP